MIVLQVLVWVLVGDILLVALLFYESLVVFNNMVYHKLYCLVILVVIRERTYNGPVTIP